MIPKTNAPVRLQIHFHNAPQMHRYVGWLFSPCELRDSHSGEICRCFGITCCLFHPGLPSNPIYTFILCPSYPCLFDHQNIFGEEYTCHFLQSHFTPSLLPPNIFPINLYTLSLCSSVNVTGQVSDPLTPTGKLIVLKTF